MPCNPYYSSDLLGRNRDTLRKLEDYYYNPDNFDDIYDEEEVFPDEEEQDEFFD